MLNGEASDALIIAVIAAVGFLVVAVVISRNTSRQKKAAIASLKEEKDLVGHYDIMAMANEEIENLELRSIAGAEGLSADVLLKTWKDAPREVRDSDRASLSYVVEHGVSPESATAAEVELVISDELPSGTHGDTAPDSSD